MLSKAMAEKINFQINREIFSSYLYLSMKAYVEDLGFKGIANWFGVQVQEELAHAEKFYNYMNQQGQRVILDAIEAPEKNFKSVLDLFEKTLEHEKKVTGLINDLVMLAKKENDFASESFLQWYVAEQVEEEANATELVQKFKLVGEDPNALMMVDKDLAVRVFVNPNVKG